MKTYTICIVKATREPKIIKSGLSIDVAIGGGDQIYQHAKMFGDFMATGVAVMVVDDENMNEFLTDRCSWSKLTAYQYGSY